MVSKKSSKKRVRKAQIAGAQSAKIGKALGHKVNKGKSAAAAHAEGILVTAARKRVAQIDRDLKRTNKGQRRKS